MKRLFFGVLAGVFAMIAAAHPVAARDVNDFVINSFNVDYNLSKDAEGRSILKTTERIKATFPSFDQNHGIERALPVVYDGHTTNLVVESVRGGNGVDLPFEAYDNDNMTILRIGSADEYVHGMQEYVISYAQRDVTKALSDTGKDEFYWDVNGTGWEQKIESVKATLIVDKSLTGSLVDGAAFCYQGPEGANERCMITKTGDGFSAQSTRTLGAREGVTIAVGLNSGTFTAYQPTAAEKFFAFLASVWVIALVVTTVFAITVLVWIVMVWQRVMRRRDRTIVPEYLPPKRVSMLLSSLIQKRPATALTAQIIDLAVRHYIKIHQTKEKKVLTAAEYELELVRQPNGLAEEEQKIIENLFGGNAAVGARFATKKLKSNYSLSQRIIKVMKQVKERARAKDGYYEKHIAASKKMNRLATICLVIGLITLSPLSIIVAIIGYCCAYALWPLTQKGEDLDVYLEGLKLYIGVAEKERLQMLQSPEGAEKVGDIKSGGAALVKLYERVLPYAVLFGQEKEWTRQLGLHYEQSNAQPDWYIGANGAVFNAALFSSSMSQFSQMSTSYYGSSDSSSTGGSSGGGFSGGGGGGGGGGGW